MSAASSHTHSHRPRARSTLLMAAMVTLPLLVATTVTAARAGISSSHLLFGMTQADYAKVFSELAYDMRRNFRSSNKYLWNASDAQRNKIEELKVLGKRIQHDEKQKAKATGSKTWKSDAGVSAALKFSVLVENSTTEGYKCGNCGEMSAVAFARLYNTFPELELNLVGFGNRDHAFVLARVPSGDTYVVDPWNGTSTGPLIWSNGKLYDKGTTTLNADYGQNPIVEYTGFVRKADKTKGAGHTAGGTSKGQTGKAATGKTGTLVGEANAKTPDDEISLDGVSSVVTCRETKKKSR